MKGIFLTLLASICLYAAGMAQELEKIDSAGIKKNIATEKEALKFNLNTDGSHFFQATCLNQVWLRANESNPGTLVDKVAQQNTLDIGLRRTRIQLFGQVTDRVFVYFQLGQNNFNAQSAYTDAGGGNRKTAFFVHDAFGDYKVFKAKNYLKLGGGLTIANGLSRFSQPSIGSIMTMDVPVFAQATVDQTDQFSRKLSVVARGQVGQFDYRISWSDPFPILSNGSTTAAGNKASPTATSFAQVGHHKQYQAYLMYQFFEHEQNNTPYMTGTYLGKKKVFNIATGFITQKNAMWKKEVGKTDSVSYQDMNLWSIESFLDLPMNKDKGTAISAYVGYFNTNYGTNYLRYNGIMNPATSSATAKTSDVEANAFGNALPMFGTGKVIYSQLGYLMKRDLLGIGNGTLMPYISTTMAKYDRLGNNNMNVFNVGINWMMNGHKSKLSVDYQNRPTYYLQGNEVKAGPRKGCLTLQYQIFI